MTIFTLTSCNDPRKMYLVIRAATALVLFGHIIFCVGNDDSNFEKHTIQQNDSVTLQGCGNSGGHFEWIFQNKTLFLSSDAVDTTLAKGIDLLPNNSLHIEFVSAEHEGTFQCRDGSHTNVSYIVIVQVPPTLTISTNTSNYINSGNPIGVRYGEVLNITCHASESKPAVVLSWMINGTLSTNSDIKRCEKSAIDGTTNCSSSYILTANATGNVTNVTCEAVFNCSESKNGEDKCNDSTSKDKRVGEINLVVTYGLTTTYTDDLPITRAPTTGTRTTDVHSSPSPEPSTGVQSSVLIILGVVAAVVSVSILTSCVLLLWRKVTALSSRNLTTIHVNNTAAIRSLPIPLVTRELPPIYPDNGESNDNAASIQDRNHARTYSNGICMDTIQLNFQLPGEGTIEFWTASAAIGEDGTRKIIARSMSENARIKESMNFRALAKNIINIPKHQNIVQVLGISLADVPYFIYQEYIEYGSMKDFLMRNYQQSSGSKRASSSAPKPEMDRILQLTVFAADICEGMVFLRRQNCRHPGLAAKKVLLGASGRSKLYDFWPVDLAQHRINQLLEKSVPPIAWLAPETVFLGHYVEKSDVWNFGVVLWEIYSLGETPFGGMTCQEIEAKLRGKEHLDQPLSCPGGIFSAMLSAWNSSIDERPTMMNIQQALMAFLNDMRSSSEEDGGQEPNYFSLDRESSEDDYIDNI